jgi:hypothetical protein
MNCVDLFIVVLASAIVGGYAGFFIGREFPCKKCFTITGETVTRNVPAEHPLTQEEKRKP